MSEVQTTPRLSLFQIENEMLQLIDARADVLERMAAMSPDELTSSPEIGAELATIDGLIRDYVSREVKKVDGIAWAVKDLRAKSQAKKQEADELYAKSKADDETADRILSFALEVLQQSGSKREEGKLFKLTRHGNGGLQALTIAQPDLVPLAFRRITVEIRELVFTDFAKQFDGEYRILEELHIDTRDVRHALGQGFGVMGARLEDRGEHIRIK